MYFPTLRAIVLATAALATTPVQAAIFRVGSGAGCTHATIQAAIDSADAIDSSQADEIRLSAGPYLGQRLTMHIAAAHGAITLVGGYATCTDAAPTAGAHTVISGVPGSTTDPVLRVSNTAELILRNLEIRGAAGASGVVLETAVGGAEPSHVTLVDTLLVNNVGITGGGLLIANYNTGTLPERLQVELQGASNVAYNSAYVRGGGVYCRNAMLSIRDSASIHDNSAGATGFSGSLDGGGIYAQDCHLDVSSAGTANFGALHRNTAALAGRGGGLYLTGANASADFYPVSAGASVLVRENRALDGGGIAIAGGAIVRMFGSSILLSNTADRAGGAIWLATGGSAGADSRFFMQSAVVDAPDGATSCASPSYCASIIGNRAVDTSGNRVSGAVIDVSGSAGTAHAWFSAARIEQNDGYNLFLQEATTSQIVLDGSLVVANQAGASSFVATGPGNAMVVSATTVANNVIATPSTLFLSPITCDPADDAIGIHLRRSIFWQPGQSLLFALSQPQAACFRHLIANDFGALGTAADRVIANPAFENAAGNDYRLSAVSPALDFAPAGGDATLDAGPRVIDLPTVTNLFGPQDLGAFERSYSPTVGATAATAGGTLLPATQNVVFGQPATISVFPETGWHAITPLGGNCPAGTFSGTTYTTGAITASCNVSVAFIHATTLGVAADVTPSVYGQIVYFEAPLNNYMPTGGAITGTVTFRDGATLLGGAQVSNSTALWATDRLDVGVHNLTAQYAGDALNTPATSPVLVQTVIRAATTTAIASPTPIHLGQPATISAAVAVTMPGSGTPTGTITVQAAAGLAGSCTITLPATNCTLTPVGASGPVTLSATYSGDAHYTGSSGAQTLTVIPQILRGSITGLTAQGLVLQLLVAGETFATTTAPSGATQFQFTRVVPAGASYLVNVDTQPTGLYCTVTNGSGTMPATDVVNVAVACSPAPHAILDTGISDGRLYARYGQTLTYTVIIGNIGTAAASGTGVVLSASPGLDTAALSWSCTASGGASCGPGGTGGLADSINVPINALVTYTVNVPVRSTTPEPQVRLEINVNGGEVIESDIDTLVILRHGFDPE